MATVVSSSARSRRSAEAYEALEDAVPERRSERDCDRRDEHAENGAPMMQREEVSQPPGEAGFPDGAPVSRARLTFVSFDRPVISQPMRDGGVLTDAELAVPLGRHPPS